MKGARALVFPSRWYEVSPLTPYEAFQFGIPLITSNCCACVDYVKDNKNGISFGSYRELISILNNDINTKLLTKFSSNYKKQLIKSYNDCLKKENVYE